MVTEGATHVGGSKRTPASRGPSVDHAKTLGASILELFPRARSLCEQQQKSHQHCRIAMASVYKTLSGAEKEDKDVGVKRNKQRVLILVWHLPAQGKKK